MRDLEAAEARLWDSLGVQPVERRVDLARLGINVRVTEVGEGPPAVFIHGATVAGSSWADLAARLPGVRCLLVDRPGCGRSEPLREPGDFDSWAEAAGALIVDVMDAFDLESAAVVATSLGGYYGVRGAALHPHRVERMVLVGWVLGTPGTQPPMWLRLGATKPMARLGARMPVSVGSVKRLLRQAGLRRAIDEGRMGDEALAWVAALFTDTDTLFNETVATPRLSSLLGGWDPRLFHDDETLAGVRAPTCVVYGEEDPFGTVTAAQELGRRIPNAEVHVLPRAGHAPWLDAPEEVAQIVSEFLGAD